MGSKRTNVLYVIWSLSIGGAERVVVNLAKGLDKQRFNPIICCLNWPGEYTAEVEREGVKVIALDKQPKLDLQIIGKLVRVMKENEVDIVHTHLWTSSFWGRIAAKKANIPVIIVTEHNVDVWKSFLHFMSDRYLSRRTNKIIAVSNKVKEFYVGKGIPTDKIEVIYNGIEIEKPHVTRHPPRESCRDLAKSPEADLADKSQVKTEFGIKDNEKVLAVIGRLVEQKGHRYLLEALSQLDGKYDYKLMIVGDGPLKESLKSQVTSHMLEDRVIFTGFRRDVSRLLGAVDVLVMPSLREGLPIIALEAMAAGVSIVATKVGGTPEVVEDGVNGVLVSPENPSELAKGLKKILENKELAKKFSENSKNRVRDLFSLEKMVRRHEELYEKLLEFKVTSRTPSAKRILSGSRQIARGGFGGHVTWNLRHAT